MSRPTDRAPSSDRGGVPFAMVAVVLLLGSVAYANTLAIRGPVVVDTAADDALDRVEAAGRPAVRTAATAAAREAALHPVVVPANSTLGGALDPDHPFRDALRLRIALAVGSALAETSADVGGVTASGSMPAVDSVADVPAAIDRVSVSPLANGTAMRVTVRNVSLTARRADEVVATRTVAYDVAVAVPVLAMHARTTAYQRRLNRSPFDGPGLGRSLTWRLWGVAQARGLGQYLGAPITNVLANRHVELSTNAAALRTQGSLYGTADSEGRAALARATGRVAATDLLAPAMASGPAWTERVLSATGAATRDASGVHTADTATNPSSGTGGIAVGVNATADRAFVALLDGTNGGLDTTLAGAYRARAIRRVTVLDRVTTAPPPRTPPSERGNWTFGFERVESETTIVARDRTEPASPTAVADRRRTVAVGHTATRYWWEGDRVRTTTATWTDRYRVRITLDVTYAPTVGPDRPTLGVFTRGGALGGPNLADVPRTARLSLLTAGTADRLATAAVDDGGGVDRESLRGRRPRSLDDWVYRDLIRLRERVRAVSVTVSRAAVAAGDANAPARLAARLRERRADLVDAPDAYDGASDRARVAARAAYVDAVLERLDARARRATDRNGAYLDRVGSLGQGVDGRLDELARIAADATAPAPTPVGRWHAGAVTLRPRGVPGYLPVTAVDARHLRSLPPGESVTPLAARNTNLFTVPTGDATDAVVDAALPARRTASLATAGRTLVAADRLARGADAASTADRTAHDRLATRVSAELATVDAELRAVLRETTDLSRSHRTAAVEAARARWAAPGARALAVTNGSYADAVASRACARGGLSTVECDRVGVRLRVRGRAVATDATVAVPAGLQTGVVDETRAARRDVLERAVSGAAENATDRLHSRYGKGRLGPVLAGLPVAPMPGYWYATVNVWDVEVAGAYPRFVVEATVGTPDGGDGVVRYVRERATVRLDVDGDGAAETLGHNAPVSFRTWTVVVVVVPAGRSGVGDVDGDADERSAGWPCPLDGFDAIDGLGGDHVAPESESDAPATDSPPASSTCRRRGPE